MGKKAGFAREVMGWRVYVMTVSPEIAKARLKTCPLKSVREKLSISLRGKVKLTYKDGMSGMDEIACTKWILLSTIPDDRFLPADTAEAIFAWVRETL